MRRLPFLLLLASCTLVLLLTACTQEKNRFLIGVSQCSDDEWRTQMNKEIRREALFYPGLDVEIRSANDDNQRQIADIEYFIDEGADLIVVAPNEAEAIAPIVEKAYSQGIPVVLVDRKTDSDPLYRLYRSRQLRHGLPDRYLHCQPLARAGQHGRTHRIEGLYPGP